MDTVQEFWFCNLCGVQPGRGFGEFFVNPIRLCYGLVERGFIVVYCGVKHIGIR